MEAVTFLFQLPQKYSSSPQLPSLPTNIELFEEKKGIKK